MQCVFRYMIYYRKEKKKNQNNCIERKERIDMLALSRKEGESIVINNNVEVTILEVKGEQIKLGINAPKDVPVYRKEIFNQIKEENEKAIFEKADLHELNGF